MRKLTISSGYSGKLSVAQYQNVNPSFFASVEYETALEGADLEAEIDAEQKRLQAIAHANFRIVADAARVEKIKNDLKGFRFYKTDHGEYPSVTTVIDPDYKPFIGEDELKIAVAEGNICHARAAHFISTGKWAEPKTLEGVASDLLLLRGKFLDVWDFPAMLAKYPMDKLKNGRQLVNNIHRYAGTNDAECLYPLDGDKNAPMVPTIIDFKRTADKHKNFTQMAAYAKCEGMDQIKQMMIVQTNTDTNQGYSKPILSSAIDKYFEVFLDLRETFKATYGA